jgi:hypothetical protein
MSSGPNPSASSFSPIGRMPQGVQLLRRDGLPPLIEQQIEKAAKSGGKYMAVVFVAGETATPGDPESINMVRVNGDKWSFDWLYRALRMLEDDIRRIPVPGTTEVPLECDADGKATIADAVESHVRPVQEAGETA